MKAKLKAEPRGYRRFRLLLAARLDSRETAVGSVQAGDEPLARGEAEKEYGHGEDDGRRAEPAGAEKVAQDAEHRAQHAGGNARAAAPEDDNDARDREQDAYDAANLAGQRFRLVFAPRPERRVLTLRAYIISVQNHPSGFILTASHPSIIPFL